MAINPLQLPNPIPSSEIPGLGASIANLGNIYKQAQKEQKLSDLGKGLANGTIDYRSAAGSLAELGSLDGSLKMLGLAEARDKIGREQAASQAFNASVGGIFSPQMQMPAPTGPGASAPARISQNTATGHIYANDEPSPLDPPSGVDRDRLARTVIAEAGNQGPTGMNAVASVVRNRAVNGGYGGDTPSGVVTAPNQFEPWNTQGGRDRMAAIDPSSPEYTAATRSIDAAYAGNDPTNGATHFYSPRAQAALGRPAPSWDDGTGRDIGGHRFFGGAPADPSQRPYDVAGPATAAPTAPAGNGAPQPSAANGFQGLNASHIPMLMQAMSNPNLPAGQKEVAGKLLTRALDDSKPSERIRTLQAIKEQSGYTGTILDLEKELRAAGKTDVTTNIDQKLESEESKAAGKGAGERRATMFASAGAASKTLQNLNRMEGLLGQVSQGKMAPATMTVSAWAKALGVNDDVATSIGLDPKGVGSAQAVQSLVNESVVGKIGAGGFPANNFSDADRAFITDIFPKLGNDPRANKIMIEGARRMAQLDIQRAKEYQAFKADPANKGKGFEDFELAYSERVAKQDIFGDLRKEAEQIIGAPRNDIGGTLNNPGPAPQQQPRGGGNTTRGGVSWSVQ